MTQEATELYLGPDLTVLLPAREPRAGGRGADTRTASPQNAQASGRIDLAQLDWQTGLNPIVAAANPLLGLASRLPQARPADPAALRATLVRAIERFETSARAAGIEHAPLIAARYALCTWLDEAAASTPWGEPVWARRSLLLQFHGEAWGGEKFFVLLGRLAERPAEHRALLELFYLILSLGFEGRYRILPDGRAQLDTLRERLARLLARERGPIAAELSPAWRSDAQAVPPPREPPAAWLVALLAVLLLALVHGGLSLALRQQSEPTVAAILGLGTRGAARLPPATAAPQARLAQFLADEIEAGHVSVTDLPDRSIVIAHGDTLFEPGSATVSPQFAQLLGRIAQAAARVEGRVLVRGHTDNRPLNSPRYPSNWHLSQARAQAVAALMAPALRQPGLIRTEGRADSEPAASNDTSTGRAANRRVEIIVYPSPRR